MNLPKNKSTYGEQVVNPQPQTLQGQPVMKPETSLQDILIESVNP